jgi:hypothetical protein
MSKKIFFLAIALLAVSVIYGLWKFNIDAPKELSATSTTTQTEVATSSIAEGTYTAFLSAEGCKGREVTLEIQADKTAYLTEDFIGCEPKKDSFVRGGTWSLEAQNLLLDLTDNNNQKSNLTLNLADFKPTTMSFFTNKKNESLAIQKGFYGPTEFVRLWKGEKDFLGTLYKKEGSGGFANETYTWKVGATTSELISSSTNEIYTQK